MLPAIESLAARVDGAWAATGYRRSDFAAVASAALAEPVPLTFSALADAMVGGAIALPRQRRIDTAFGQPPITLHYDDRFVIEALCWADGSPAIHEHAFNGAFQILTGRSVHTTYAFSPADLPPGGGSCAAPLRAGDLELGGWEILAAGDTRAIEEGESFIHAAFHLDAPSMTLVVRTHDSGAPEHTYLPPGLALDPAARDAALTKRLQLLDTVDRCRGPGYWSLATRAIANFPLYDAVHVVLRAARHHVTADLHGALVGALLEHHPDAPAVCGPALIEAFRRDRLTLMRASVTDPADRIVLACLLSFGRRAPLLGALVAHTGSHGAAVRAVGAGVTSLLGLDASAAPLVTTAVSALLDDAGASLPEPIAPLYEELRAHPLLRPLTVVGR